MRLLMLAASLRKDSVNKKLIHLAAKLAKETGSTIDLADFNEFSAPLYNADVQNQEGFPKNILSFVERMHAADGLIISTPEYNYSIPGTLKNLIDWVSRISPMPWSKQRILLISASPSLVGGNRGLWATRVPLEGCGAFVYPDMFSLASAHANFKDDGDLADAEMQKRLQVSVDDFVSFVKKLK